MSDKSPFEQIKDAPCMVHSIEVTGNKRTRTGIILREFNVTRDATTLEEIMSRIFQVQAGLDELKVFSKVKVYCDEGPEDEPNTMKILVDVKEKKSTRSGSVGIYAQGAETTFQANGTVRNILGNAEIYQVDLEAGAQSSSTFSLSATQPRLNGTDADLAFRLFKTETNNTRHSSYKEHLQGASATLTSGAHQLAYELSINELSPERLASRLVRQQAGHNLKSALSHLYMVDNRDDPYTGTPGAALRVQTELAGIGTDPKRQRFVKHETELQFSVPLPMGMMLNLSSVAGLLVPWHTEKVVDYGASAINERFYIGGPQSLRGFKMRGVGPSDARRPAKQGEASSGEASSSEKAAAKAAPRDFLGGDLKFGSSAALTFQFPNRLLDAYNVRGQLFVDAGTVMPLPQASTGMGEVAKTVRDNLRVTAGVGVYVPTRLGRIEINYCHVLRHQEFDRVKRGIQLGIVPVWRG